MTNSNRLIVGLIASALAAGFHLPASAAELALPSPHKVAGVAMPAKHLARPHTIKIASAAWPPSSDYASQPPYPIILGIAY